MLLPGTKSLVNEISNNVYGYDTLGASNLESIIFNDRLLKPTT